MEPSTLSLRVEGDDAREVEQATRVLREELDRLRDVRADAVAGVLPAGAKAAGALELGQIVLTLLGSGGVAVGVIAALKDWLTRNRRMKLRVKRGDVEVELDVAAADELPAALATLRTLLQPPS